MKYYFFDFDALLSVYNGGSPRMAAGQFFYVERIQAAVELAQDPDNVVQIVSTGASVTELTDSGSNDYAAVFVQFLMHSVGLWSDAIAERAADSDHYILRGSLATMASEMKKEFLSLYASGMDMKDMVVPLNIMLDKVTKEAIEKLQAEVDSTKASLSKALATLKDLDAELNLHEVKKLQIEVTMHSKTLDKNQRALSDMEGILVSVTPFTEVGIQTVNEQFGILSTLCEQAIHVKQFGADYRMFLSKRFVQDVYGKSLMELEAIARGVAQTGQNQYVSGVLYDDSEANKTGMKSDFVHVVAIADKGKVDEEDYGVGTKQIVADIAQRQVSDSAVRPFVDSRVAGDDTLKRVFSLSDDPISKEQVEKLLAIEGVAPVLALFSKKLYTLKDAQDAGRESEYHQTVLNGKLHFLLTKLNAGEFSLKHYWLMFSHVKAEYLDLQCDTTVIDSVLSQIEVAAGLKVVSQATETAAISSPGDSLQLAPPPMLASTHAAAGKPEVADTEDKCHSRAGKMRSTAV